MIKDIKIKFKMKLGQRLIGFLLLLFTLNNFAQVQHPVSINTLLQPPYSPFLVDYHSPNSNLFKINVAFNDFNEPSWNVYFKIRIESSNALIVNKNEFKPSAPVTLFPGQQLMLSGFDLTENFQYQNLNVSGVDIQEFMQNGMMPEGFYTFKVEAYDYNSGKILSETSMASAFINYCDPPTIIQPSDGSFIPTDIPQNILFQWNLINPPGGSLINTEFSFKLYEITDSLIDPKIAIASNKVVPIYNQEHITTSIFNYDLTCPQLEIGKRYTYTVQAHDTRGRASFKNNGLSEAHWFYYGYPMGGVIDLMAPMDSTGFGHEDEPIFRWSAPSNKEPLQPVKYSVEIFKILENQTPEDAVNLNPVFINHETNTTLSNLPYIYVLDQPLERAFNYAWKVTAFSGNQQVAKSEVNVLLGPPLLEEFYVESHTVIVTETYNTNLDNLSGRGKVQISPDGTQAELEFENLKIRKDGNWYFLDAGVIKSKVENIAEINLTPNKPVNGNAVLYLDSLRLMNGAGLSVKGKVIWDFPMAVAPGSPSEIHTQTKWIGFNSLKATGYLYLDQTYEINLLDPYGFKITFNTASNINLFKNRYYLRMYGDVQLPNSVEGTLNQPISVNFSDITHLDYFTVDNIDLNNKIKLINNTNFQLNPKKIIFDFSDSLSPPKHNGNTSWKGAYFEEFKIHLPENTDEGGQLLLNDEYTPSFVVTSSNQTIGWVNSSGLTLFAEKNLQSDDDGTFNTFPAKNFQFKIDIENNTFNNGFYKGTIKIPVIDESENFNFTVPLSTDGFQIGYLDEDLTNFQFDFNPDKPQQVIHVTIKNAVFDNNECLKMGLDMEWPNLGVTMQNVTGFKAWGNYRIGFNSPNGVAALTDQLTGSFRGYQVTMDEVGAGSSGGMYAFGTSAKIIMSDDIAGATDAPVANIYSMVPCSYLDPNESYPSNNNFDSTYLINQINDLNGQMADNAANFDAAIANYNSDQTQYLNNLANLQTNLYDPSGGQDFTVEEIIGEADSLVGGSAPANGSGNLDKTLNKISNVAQIVAPDLAASFDVTRNFVSNLSLPQVNVSLAKIEQVETMTLNFVEGRITELSEDLAQPITDKVAEINSSIQTKIDSLVQITEMFVGSQVDSILESFRGQLVSLGAGLDGTVDVESIVDGLISSASGNIKDEINESIELAVNDDITVPAITFVNDNVSLRVLNSVKAALWSMSAELISSGFNGSLNIDFEYVIDTCASNLFANIDFGKLTKKVGRLGKDAIENFSFNDVYQGMLDDLTPQLSDLFDYAQGLLNDQINEAMDAMANALGVDGSLDLGNNIDKLINGEIPDIYSLDPIYIKVETSIAEFEGMAKFTKDDPEWGDSWQAMLAAELKVKPNFTAEAQFINGKMPDFNYWFLAVAVSNMNIPLAPIPMALNGVSGKVYHHMIKSGDSYIPSTDCSYGAGLGMELSSTPNTSVFRLSVGVEVAILQGGFEMTLDGELGISYRDNGYPLVIATGTMMYNSIDKHFLGILNAETLTDPIFCATAQLIVDIKSASDWMIAIGTQENPIVMKPYCPISLTSESYLIADNSGLEVSFKIIAEFYASTNWIDIGVTEIQAFASLYFEFGASCEINWKPLSVEHALVYLNINIDVGVKYKQAGSIKTIHFIALNLHGQLEYVAEPRSKISGELSGSVRILCVSAGFALSASHTF